MQRLNHSPQRVRKNTSLMHCFIICSWLLALAATASCAVGKCGPTILFWNSLDRPDSFGLGMLSQETWASCENPGSALFSPDERDVLFGGLRGMSGDVLVASGSSGIAIAVGDQPSSRWAGIMRSRVCIPHSVVLGSTWAVAVALLVINTIGGRRDNQCEPHGRRLH